MKTGNYNIELTLYPNLLEHVSERAKGQISSARTDTDDGAILGLYILFRLDRERAHQKKCKTRYKEKGQ